MVSLQLREEKSLLRGSEDLLLVDFSHDVAQRLYGVEASVRHLRVPAPPEGGGGEAPVAQFQPKQKRSGVISRLRLEEVQW